MDVLPTWFFYLAAGVLGLELGGLATIFIQRWIDERPIMRPGRSACPACNHRLSLRDTIPVASYLLLRGRCRHCQARIGGQYMLVELSCLAWALALAHAAGPTLGFAIHLILGVMLIAGSFIDFETFMLPDRITLGGTGLALASLFVLEEPGLRDGFMGAAVGAFFFWILQQLYRIWRKEEGLGTGDVKLMAMLGAMVGLAGLPLTILVAAVAAVVAGVSFIFRTGGDGLKTRIRFGPFLSLGAMFTVLYGDPFLSWWGAL